MPKQSTKRTARYGAKFSPIDISPHYAFPRRVKNDPWWRGLADSVRAYPEGEQTSWGIPFHMSAGKAPRVALAAKGRADVVIPVGKRADYVCLLHEWRQMPHEIRTEDPREGLVVAEYVLEFSDRTSHVSPVRARFEVGMVESPGPAWLACPFRMWSAIDPTKVPEWSDWAYAQTGTTGTQGAPLVYALPNPELGKTIRSLRIRGLMDSPLLVAGLTLYRGASHPMRHLPRRVYRVDTGERPVRVEEATVDLGGVARIQRTSGPRGKKWLDSPLAGLGHPPEKPNSGDDLLELFGAEDASVEVTLRGRKRPVSFSLGEAFHEGASAAPGGRVRLKVLDKTRQWMQVVVKDASTGNPTPVRIHFSGPDGQYVAPYGHHEQINTGWFMDYGADVVAGGRNYAYVRGTFTTDLPVGDLYVEINKGFEYAPVRTKVAIRPGQKQLTLSIDRWKDLRSEGWVTADTHVHFISPQTAWLEGEAEGVNVVNLLASQWGRLFTNVGDLTGKVGVAENDTIVFVGTENRNHMLGHMSMLGTQDLPVFPMCGGGPTEAWLGDPDFRCMTEWALENRRKGGVVIRPHYPYCGYTEDPVPVIAGLVDALEIHGLRGTDFATQEWYRYLNCGYRVAVAGGTDKMGAHCPLGWLRTYALIDRNRPFTYDAWATAVRKGRTFATTGPLVDLRVDGKCIGDTIRIPASGATLEVRAKAESCWPIGRIELVHNGRVVAAESERRQANALKLRAKLNVRGPGWIAARCTGHPRHPCSHIAAHTSPVYLTSGDRRLFDGPAAEHMLGLVEGSIEYMNTLATVFDESSRNRMVKIFNDVRRALRGRLVVEGHPHPYHGGNVPHTHR